MSPAYKPAFEKESVTPKRSDESVLVFLAKSGDHSAYSELCTRHSKQVYLTVLRVTKSKEDAEDALQESLMKALIHLQSFDGRSTFSTWLTRIAINSALMMKRKARNRPEQQLDSLSDERSHDYLQIADQSVNAEGLLYGAERSKHMTSAIGRLPKNLRMAVELQLKQDVNVRELAALLGISIPATKSRLLRARALLRHSVARNSVFNRERPRLMA
jgi:RNA polymerase sigma factor (sigma-70 family)